MKAQNITFTFIAVAALALTGCGKKDAGDQAAEDAKKVGSTLSETAGKVAETVKTEAGKVTEAVKKESQATTEAATAQAQSLIDKAKTLIADKKFQDASAALQQLGSIALTPEQQKLVAELKEQIKKGLEAAAGGASAAGNLLKK